MEGFWSPSCRRQAARLRANGVRRRSEWTSEPVSWTGKRRHFSSRLSSRPRTHYRSPMICGKWFLPLALTSALGISLGGCGISDPTENTGPMRFRNDLPAEITISYCQDLTCKSFFWDGLIKPGEETSPSVLADGSRSRFVVTARGSRRCITLNLTRAVAVSGLSIRRGILGSCPASGFL